MPDEFLTIDEVAERMALPPEMIRRRIESGDIPVHWVEVGGKLEMRVAADDVGGAAAAQVASPPTPFPTPAEPEFRPTAGETAASGWETDDEEYPQRLWAPVEETAASAGPSPWAESAASQPEVVGSPDETTDVPVWRPDPATWEDEQLESAVETTNDRAPDYSSGFSAFQEQEGSNATSFAAGSPFAPSEPQVEEEDQTEEPASFATPEASAFDYGAESPTATTAYPPPEPAGEAADFEPPGSSEYGAGFTGAPEPYSPEPAAAEESPFAPSSLPEEEEPAAPGFAAPPPPAFAAAASEEAPAFAESEFATEDLADTYPASEEVTYAPAEPDKPPSAMLASTAAGSLAMGAIDARELVAGLFERWERALEQRIQAEQRLRFEAELEQRMRQVRDLRQELDTTRKTQAAQLAEREREIMDLRSRLQEVERAPKGRGLFRR